MRYLVFAFIATTLSLCSHDVSFITHNHFSSYQDTLVIRTHKQEGTGLFLFGAGPMNFKDTSESFPHDIKYPSGIEALGRALIHTDFTQDTNYVNALLGYSNGKEVYILDENNNRDLTDDEIRPIERIDWTGNKGSVKCKYYFSEGNEVHEDSSWVKIGIHNGSTLQGRNENLIARFTIDQDTFTTTIQDQAMSGTFSYSNFHSQIALIANNELKKDTLFEADLMKNGEYLNLNDHFYRYDSISLNGRYVTLVKVEEFDDKVGTQAGMIAPKFEFVSVEGDTISSEIFEDEMLIVANSCGCGGDKESLQAFFDIQERYGDEVNIIRLDSGLKKGMDGLHINMDEAFNKDLYSKFRNAYCSRIYYVVGSNGRVLNKFNGSDWETVLPSLITLAKE